MTADGQAQDDPILLSEHRAGNGRIVGFVQLNAPRSLNALSAAMITPFRRKLDEWRRRDDVVCVVLHGTGERAFCAGGDVVGVHHAIRAAGSGPGKQAERYFIDEYDLDHAIHCFPKPLVCWGSGYVMGGGLGMLAGAGHRVVTDTTTLAMPEMTIGLFPDVGANWFLNRMPGRVGLFLALTGSRINATDAWLLGLADVQIDDDQRQAVFEALLAAPWQGDAGADQALTAQTLRRFEQAAERRPDSRVLAHRDVIARVTDVSDPGAMLDALTAAQGDDPWLQQAARTMQDGSPTSLAVAFEQLRTGRHLSLAQTLQRDVVMAIRFTRQADFVEGVRALLVDKDKTPTWSPATLDEVTADQVAAYFRLPGGYAGNPLSHLD